MPQDCQSPRACCQQPEFQQDFTGFRDMSIATAMWQSGPLRESASDLSRTGFSPRLGAPPGTRNATSFRETPYATGSLPTSIPAYTSVLYRTRRTWNRRATGGVSERTSRSGGGPRRPDSTRRSTICRRIFPLRRSTCLHPHLPAKCSASGRSITIRHNAAGKRQAGKGQRASESRPASGRAGRVAAFRRSSAAPL